MQQEFSKSARKSSEKGHNAATAVSAGAVTMPHATNKTAPHPTILTTPYPAAISMAARRT